MYVCNIRMKCTGQLAWLSCAFVVIHYRSLQLSSLPTTVASVQCTACTHALPTTLQCLAFCPADSWSITLSHCPQNNEIGVWMLSCIISCIHCKNPFSLGAFIISCFPDSPTRSSTDMYDSNPFTYMYICLLVLVYTCTYTPTYVHSYILFLVCPSKPAVCGECVVWSSCVRPMMGGSHDITAGNHSLAL